MWGCIKVASRFGFGAAGCRFLAPLFLGLLPTPGALADPEVPRIEFFTGFESSDNYTSAYVGGGYAFGKGFHQESLRLRAVGSLGRYHYDSSLESDGVWVPTRFDGDASFMAALAGYEFHFGRVISKIFAGVEAVDQQINPRDPNNSVQGSEIGFRIVSENWIDLSPIWHLSADAAYGTAFQEYWSLVRIGYRLKPRLSVGLEGGAVGNQEYDAGRAAPLRGSIFSIRSSPWQAASRAITWKTIRAVTSRSASVALFDLRKSRCTAGPAPAVLGLNHGTPRTKRIRPAA
jgi:hypothetical protein